ncbi:Rho termination factor N-terminal domain-containing protein [Streptomyces sp. NPDC052687]|uniref:Rho termination factor N-terminal domain-containing protein n=1 Tax=Streptomyces sp. NPDC052687 TaxID=3154759 RepID=UPI00342AFC1F
MADDLITLVTTDHRELQRLFEMMKTDKSSRPLALPLAVAMLEAHSEAEEDRVYPAVAREAGEKAGAEHAAEEHHEAESLGKHLLELDWESEEFDQALQEWIDAVEHHMEEEENEILPALSEAVGTERLRELGREFATRRAKALAGQPLKAAGGAGGGGGGTEGETRAELYEKARELGVEGRSTMNKEELAEQVAKAEDAGNG